ncbi:MAG: DUF2029 domain-containing protein [Chloroflexi bacterium]|nr:DUF2029 domain-containing protein [Chloroflexota bacterium]
MSPRGVALVAFVVALASAAPRVLAAQGLLPGPLIVLGWSDPLDLWYTDQLIGHRVPYRDIPFAYPPLVGYLVGLLSLLVPGVTWYIAGWGIVIALAAAAAAYALARAATPVRALAFWACSAQLLLLSAINFDVLASLFVVLAAVAARQAARTRSLVLLAFGAAAKLFPFALAPVVILRALADRDRRGAVLGAATFALALGLIYLPASLGVDSTAQRTATYAYGDLVNRDSVWGLISAMFGSNGIDIRPLIAPLSLAGTALTYLVLVVPRAWRTRDPVVGFALATLTLLLWSRLYSPQYSLWLLPFFVLLPLRTRTYVYLTIADVGVFFTIFPLTLLRPVGVDAAFLYIGMSVFVALRHVSLVLMWRDVTATARAR